MAARCWAAKQPKCPASMPRALDVAGTIVGGTATRFCPRRSGWRERLAVRAAEQRAHTNGYSLIRRALAGEDLTQTLSDGRSLADALLAPHRCYVAEVERLQAASAPLLGLAHITGGGFVENVPRALPDSLCAVVETRTWRTPEVFALLVERSGLGRAEAFRVFNMGIGLVLIAPASARAAMLAALPGD